MLTNLTCCQLGALLTWCIAANPMHCRPGAFPAPHQRLGEGCWGGCGTACPRMEEPGGGGVQLTALPSPVTAAALSEEAAALFHPALLKIPLPILIPLLFWVLFRAGSRK